MKKFLKKSSALLLSILTACSICTASVSVQAETEEGNADFTAFMSSEFKDAMEADYMTMHYTVKDTESMGLTKPEATIGTISLQDYEDNVNDAKDSLDSLHAFDYDSLSDTQQHDYKDYENYLTVYQEVNSYPMLDFYFYPGSGIQSNLLTNFTEFIFYSNSDVDDYLSVLKSVPEYIDEALELTKTQASKGYFLSDTALNDTEEEIEKFTSVNDESNQLIVIFNENIDALDSLTDAQKVSYKAENKDIVLNEFIPAYEKINTELEKLRGSRSESDGGLSSLSQDGADYYASYAKYQTSSDLSVSELKDLCTDYLNSTISELQSLYQKNKKVFDNYDSETLDMSTPEEILSYLQDHMSDYPEGPEVTYKASYLDASVANDTTMAYYMEPPIDDIKDNVIKINGSNISDSVTLYETLAHEGFPGHLYQITYDLNTNPLPMRSAITNMGYTEGWAMYVEVQAMKDSGLTSDTAEVYQIDTKIGYVLQSAVDLGVNGLGWTREDTSSFLSDYGYEDATDDLYDAVVENPGQLLPYGLGLVQFDNLRSEAEQSLGSDMNLQEYHAVLLKYSDRPFSEVESDVKEWIASVQGENGTSVSSSADTSGSNQWILITAGVLAAVVIAAVLILKKSYRKDPFE